LEHPRAVCCEGSFNLLPFLPKGCGSGKRPGCHERTGGLGAEEAFGGTKMERIFDATSILKHFIQTNQEIRCDYCGETIELERLETLKLYDMQCFKCKKGRCAVVNLSKKYEQIIAAAKSELLLPVAELCGGDRRRTRSVLSVDRKTRQDFGGKGSRVEERS
jgi:hypothetical protein